ncbi:segregation/condensation protein A [Candidatus Nomurabacteria bacterium]|nr:segregation/condensation protein A [Candidatus Nomurabacteria bacterium]
MPQENTTSVYTVRSGSFEGPLELLLTLIEQRKLFVNEISLAVVTNEYIAHIKYISEKEPSKRISDISYFVLIAATLILIKSKSLLPNLELTEDEEEKISDLESRLKLYQIIKTASIDIKNIFGTQIIFFPVERVWSDPLFSADENITVSSMSKAIGDVLTSLPKEEAKLPEIEVKKVINIDEMIMSLTDRIQNAMNMSFRQFATSHGAQTDAEAKVHVIVSFLAMLELVREGLIDVIQNNSFEDIEINKQVSTGQTCGEIGNNL